MDQRPGIIVQISNPTLPHAREFFERAIMDDSLDCIRYMGPLGRGPIEWPMVDRYYYEKFLAAYGLT